MPDRPRRRFVSDRGRNRLGDLPDRDQPNAADDRLLRARLDESRLGIAAMERFHRARYIGGIVDGDDGVEGLAGVRPARSCSLGIPCRLGRAHPGAVFLQSR